MALIVAEWRSGGYSQLARRVLSDRAIRAALLFWAFSYVILTVRWLLASEAPGDLASAKRAISTLVGAVAFRAFICFFPEPRHRLRRWVAGALIVAALSACTMVAVRYLVGQILEGANSSPLADEVRLVILWDGYFLAALLAWALASLASSASPAAAVAGPALAVPPSPEFWVQRQGLSVRVPIERLDLVQAEGNYVRLHFEGSSGLMRGSLGQIEDGLDRSEFARIHRSLICRRSLIAAVRRTRTGAVTAILADGRELPVGRRYLDRVRSGTLEIG